MQNGLCNRAVIVSRPAHDPDIFGRAPVLIPRALIVPPPDREADARPEPKPQPARPAPHWPDNPLEG